MKVDPGGGRVALIIMAVAFFFVGGIFLFIAGGTLLKGERYRWQGVRAEAIATGKTLHRATSTTATAYEVTYRFTLPGEAPSVRAESVPVHVWESAEQGSPLSIEYIPNQLDSVRVVAERPGRSQMLIFLGIGIVLVLGGLFALKQVFTRSSDAEVMPPVASTSVPAATEPSFWPLARQSAGFWLGGILLLLGSIAFLAGGSPLYNDWTFARQAASTQGMVLTKEIERFGRRNESKRYRATYRFTAAGRTFEGREELSFDGWQRLIEREPTEVLYLPNRPASSRLAGPRAWFWTAFIALLGAIVTTIAGTIFMGAVRHARLEWRLRQSGVHANGTITELRDRNLKINGVRQWRLHYEFSDYQGRRHRKSADVAEDEAQTWKVGESGKVLYDSARPDDAVWLGRV
jgi:Protein of unknown function (DUF3592)